ncbi:MAG: hypothetical protein WCF67_06265 [Chitinophagaceae bacterium]
MESHIYFKPIDGYFWQWEEEGTVVAIPNSSTIAYGDFIIEVLEKLCDQGIPPFGSMLLTLIATNKNGEKALDDVYALMDKKLGESNSTREPLKSAIVFLKQLSQLPKQYKEGNNRVLLLQTLFANCHNIFSSDRSEGILALYKSGRINADFMVPNAVFHYNVYNNDFKVISLLAKKFPDQKSILQKLTAIPEINEELEIQEPEPAEVVQKGFIEQLTDNSKTFHVGSLVKRLWSGLNIPHHNMLPSRQPMGGVSDLTNKGDFDRLLISEFANEDIVFLSRLANNEALYINREIPPQNNNLERIILIDVSLRNWGTPKTVAHALMLAIAKHPKTDIHCSAFAVGNTYQPLSWESVDDIIRGLQVLEPCLHPAQGLEAFFKEYRDKKNIEVFFISSPDTYRLLPLHKTISDHYTAFNYWIQTDDKGNIDLYKRQQNNKKHVQHLLLPLEELWKKPPQPQQKESGGKAWEGPRIYPILFAEPFNPKAVLTAANGETFMLTAEKSLMRLIGKDRKSGWELLYENLPFNAGEMSIGITASGDHILLLFNMQDRQILMLNIEQGFKKTGSFLQWRSSRMRQFIFHEDKFYYVYTGYPNKYWTFELKDEIIINGIEGNPKAVLDVYDQFNEHKRQSYTRSYNGGILKNIFQVYINQLDNLVFNNHELRLTDHRVMKLEQTHFRERKFDARFAKNGFTFGEGSTITINRTGMLAFQSSNPAIGTFYIPSVLDVSLGAASETDFAGNDYFRLENSGQQVLTTLKFWQAYMEQFIHHISHGA